MSLRGQLSFKINFSAQFSDYLLGDLLDGRKQIKAMTLEPVLRSKYLPRVLQLLIDKGLKHFYCGEVIVSGPTGKAPEPFTNVNHQLVNIT